MTIKWAAIPAIICALTLTMPGASAQVDAATYFQKRQNDLVDLAGHLGALHRLQQLCGYSDLDKYRRRMQQLVPMEVPMGSTRLDMIEAFNRAYRSTSREHLSCTAITRERFRMESKQSLAVVERLYSPFRTGR